MKFVNFIKKILKINKPQKHNSISQSHPEETNSIAPDINLIDLLNLFGYSIHSKEMKNILDSLKCSPLDEYWDMRKGECRISFTDKKNFNNLHGNLMVSVGENEPIFDFMIIYDVETFEKESPNIHLPYSLKANLTKEEVREKIGIAPYEKYSIYLPESKEGFIEYYDCENFVVQAEYDDKNRLVELQFKKMWLEEREKLNFNKSIKKQRKNIQPEFAEKVLSAKKDIPDLSFGTEDNLEFAKKIEKELNIFVDNCVRYTKSRNPKAIYNSVKKVVEKINDINYEYALIGTLERETICEYIDEVVKLTGFEISEEIDITEKWREW